MQKSIQHNLDEFGDMRRASTIIPVRQTGNNLEVLLLRRHENIEFAGGAYVFPGGRHDAGDKTLLPDNSGINEIAKLAAIRECYEETGFLFARNSCNENSGNELVGDRFNGLEYRNKIIHKPALFAEFLAAQALTPALDLLIPLAIWVPPEYAAKRYLTWFFVAEIAAAAQIIPDQSEITDFMWCDAKTALRQIQDGQINALFPTMANLALLAEFSDFATLQQCLENHQCDCKNMPLIRTKTIDKGINLWVETDVKDLYPYSTEHFH